MAACFKGAPFLFTNRTIKLILCEGTTRVLKRRKKVKAGEIMFEFPDCVVCHADSFFLGRPIPILAIHDRLLAGQTYFVLPLDRLPGPPEARGGALSAATLSTLGSPSNGCLSSSTTPPRVRPLPPLIKFSGCINDGIRGDGTNNGDCNKSPFEYIRDKDGRVYLIKVVPEFIKMIITSNYGGSISPSNCGNNLICTTPELQKQYEQLVRAKDQAWSPKLETISEHHKNNNNNNNVRFSPGRFIAMEWKIKKIKA